MSFKADFRYRVSGMWSYARNPTSYSSRMGTSYGIQSTGFDYHAYSLLALDQEPAVLAAIYSVLNALQ